MTIVISFFGHCKRTWCLTSQNSQLFQSDLNLDPMTLKLKLGQDVLPYQNEVFRSRHSKVTHTDRQTDRQTQTCGTEIFPSRLCRYQ